MKFTSERKVQAVFRENFTHAHVLTFCTEEMPKNIQTNSFIFFFVSLKHHQHVFWLEAEVSLQVKLVLDLALKQTAGRENSFLLLTASQII